MSVSVYVYNPRRDIPEAVRELRTLSPSRIREWIRDHRTKRDKVTGKRVQVDVTRQSVTMWLRRHPAIREALKMEIRHEELSRDAIYETIFENGVFRELASIKRWMMKMRARGAKEDSIMNFVRFIKHVCIGQLPHGIMIKDWGLKHPDRLILEDCLKYNSEMMKHELKGRNHRLAMRNFLKSRNVEGWDEISGDLEDAGKYADLFVSKEKIYEILEWLRSRNQDAYLSSKFAYKTGARISATLKAHASNINFEDRTITVLEKAVKGKKKRRTVKLIPDDLWEELHKEGKLFNIEPDELNDLLRTAYKEIIPEIAERIPQSFHFWRHMFAQHMLRASNWNYGLVASLGGWSLEALRRYYGIPPKQVMRRFGIETLPKI